MNLQDKQPLETDSKKCQGCKTFFGCEAFKGFCSTCFKKQGGVCQEKKEDPVVVKEAPAEKVIEPKPEEKEVKKEQTNRMRCWSCNKKIGLLGIECKCNYVFCNGHRMPEEHQCTFNHMESGKNKLENDLVKLTHEKIDSI